MKPKFIFVFGGVMSGIGKGIATSSIAKLLQARGYRVTAIKIDPYVNVDAGTMNPTEHGEVFVLASGLETDQDMGNYERFLQVKLPASNYMTTGSVYQKVIQRERNLEYQGKCVQIIPHVTGEVIETIKKAAEVNNAEIVITEIGGTTGDYENDLYTEAVRIMRLTHPGAVLPIMIGYVPFPGKIGEMKTKPTQQAVRALNEAGIQPKIIIARSEKPIDDKRKEKIALFCNVQKEAVISAPDVESIYEVPLNFEKDHLSELILKKLDLEIKPIKLDNWKNLVDKIKHPKGELKIGIVGKYFAAGECVLSDAYISVIEAVKHAAYHLNLNPKIDWLNAEDFEPQINADFTQTNADNTQIDADDSEEVETRHGASLQLLKHYHGIIVPGGFGERGIEGKIAVIKFCRENKIPYFGLCYGMQLMMVEFARNVLGLKGAHTTEIDPKTKYPIIDIMESQKKNLKDKHFGATMRLGEYLCKIKKGTIAYEAYGKEEVLERHRHRYEVNSKFVDQLEKGGVVFSGVYAKGNLMEIAELPREMHPFMLGSQFHPEFTSAPLAPNPLFLGFAKAATKKIV